MKIATYMKAAPKSIKGQPRPADTYRAARRNAAKIKMRIAAADGVRNDPTIQRAPYRPGMMPHQSTRECARRVRQGKAPVAATLLAAE
jgi:hypothetical protein